MDGFLDSQGATSSDAHGRPMRIDTISDSLNPFVTMIPLEEAEDSSDMVRAQQDVQPTRRRMQANLHERSETTPQPARRRMQTQGFGMQTAGTGRSTGDNIPDPAV